MSTSSPGSARVRSRFSSTETPSSPPWWVQAPRTWWAAPGAWGRFDHLYQGCLLDQSRHGVWGFYRYHIPDPVYFHSDIRVTLQQMSGTDAKDMLKHVKPADYPEMVNGHNRFDPKVHENWQNFEPPQDVCATAYWYQTLPSPDWGPIAPYAERMKDLLLEKK